MNSAVRTDCFNRHLDAFGDAIAKVLAYLSQWRSQADFESGMKYVLSKIKYAKANATTTFSHHKLHPTKADLIANVMSLDARRYFTLLSKYHSVDNKRSKWDYENLLTGSIQFQERLLNRIRNDISPVALERSNSVYAHCRLILESIFDYKMFVKGGHIVVNNDGSGFKWVSSSQPGWCAGQYVEALGVRYCPYCNAETIYAFSVKNKKKTLYASALDHFLPKSEYPFLALNLNNLVPSCTRCNTSLKNVLNTNLQDYATPYREDVYRTFRMKLDASDANIMAACKGQLREIPLQFEAMTGVVGQKVKRLMYDVFKWEDVYNQIFRVEVVDVLRRVRLLTPTYRRWLSSGDSLSRRSIERVLFGATMSRSEITQFRFAKVIQDLAERYAGTALRN